MTGAEHLTFLVIDVATAMQVTARRVRADIDVPEVAAFDLIVDRTFAGGSSGDPAEEARNVVVGIGGRVFSAGLDRGIEHAIATVMSALPDET